MTMSLRFLEAARTPMKSNGGWAVPPNFGKDRNVYVNDLVKKMDAIGLERNKDYRILAHGRYDNELITRVTFDTDEAFLMAKVCYG
jgi:hypothetical protein